MRGPARLLLILAVPLALGKFLEVFLSSKPGKALAARTGQAVLATDEGIDLAKKYAQASAVAVGTAMTALAGNVNPPLQALPNPKTMSMAAVIEDTAELLLATGAVIKVVGSFIRDKEKLRAKTLGGYMPRVELPRVESRFPADR
jgi:ABC-type branched-subunit amino acid transport system permease subunit